MAEQLQAIQRRIKSIESTEKIASAMQLVAAAKLKQATNRFNYCKQHLVPLIKTLREEIDSRGFGTDHGYFTGPEEIAPSLTIVITACKGMCGSYNSSIIKELDSVEAMTTFLPMGLKGYEHIKSKDLFLLEDYINALNEKENISHQDIHSRFRYYYEKPSEEHSYTDLLTLSQRIVSRQHAGEISEVHIVYAAYKNSMAYEVVNRMIIPVYNIEPNHEISTYIAELLALSIYTAISEASLNEYGARRLAMKNATDNAEEILGVLETRYHRARQAQITDELIEIISGTESQREIEKLNQKKREK